MRGSTKTLCWHKEPVSAALLAFFLGGFGIHKFYLGRPFQGILCLLFFWTLIPGIIAFIEFIVYLCMSDESFAAKYG
ncbi:MAG: TM2 domain-containing protein [Cystobacterineae bacterium]|nr:TM2 domain-containing protein [Cystobacterineae bacterium]MCL2258522.1 TM2 domain-containing protein [Cystobacterineae bacterium]